MRIATRPPADIPAAIATNRDAESLFRSKPIAEIRSVEAQTKKEIEEKKEELRQLVGKSYRDLIESADSIISMKSSCESIDSNLSAIGSAIDALSPSESATLPASSLSPNPARAKIYGIACRVKYLVDTPEKIWGCLDESMLLEASWRYLRAKEVYGLVTAAGGGAPDVDVLSKFPLLKHQWQIVGSFKSQISQKSRERFMDRDLTVGAYADALAAAATVDDLNPKLILGMFLDSRRFWISQNLAGFVSGPDSSSTSAVLCEAMRMIRTSLGQVGELFLAALNELPLFYKLVLGSPPGTQLFGGIPNPEDEVRLWKSHREHLESVMVSLEADYVAETCSSWLRDCCDEIFGELANGKRLMDSMRSGDELATAEKLVRETLDGREELEGSLEQWLKSVFGSDVASPWDQIRGLILKEGKDILELRLEDAFMRRMKEIVHFGCSNLKKDINLNDSIEGIVAGSDGEDDFQSYLKKCSTGGGVWFAEPNNRKTALGYNFKPTADENDFKNCLNAYLGPEVSRIRDALDARFGGILEDVLCFVESQNSTLRLKELAPFHQDNCFMTVSALLRELEDDLGWLSAALENITVDKNSQPPSVLVERSLFIGRLLFSLREHSSQIPLILGSPRNWVKETSTVAFSNLASPLSKQKGTFDSPIAFSPRRRTFDSPRSPRSQFIDSPRRQIFSAVTSLFTVDDNKSPKLEELHKTMQDLCVKAYRLWIAWVSNELSVIFAKELSKDDALSSPIPLRGWEVTVIRQEPSSEGSPEMKIALPSMPSLYITHFLFQACLEIHKVGGHVLDRSILRNFACRLLEKVISIYEYFLTTVEASESHVSDKGVLQILLDIRFSADILSGGTDFNSNSPESNSKGDPPKSNITKPPFRRKQLQESASKDPVMGLIRRLSQRLDPIDWATYEPYLWENEKQSYKRFAVLFGFLVQLNHMHTDTVQKLPSTSNTDSNILRCSTIPRFKYLPISAPALSSRGQHRSIPTSADDGSRSPWKSYSNGELTPKHEFDESGSSGVATPLLKSFMTQVGSKFGESTSRWGSMLSDGQVGKLKDRSAAAMSTFGDMLPGSGLLSSFTSGAIRYES